jgi:hypothetical protein
VHAGLLSVQTRSSTVSYSLNPYLVDLDALARAVGSKDESIIAAVTARDPEAFAEDDGDDEEISLGRALRDLVMGNPPVEESAHQYGYALEQLCDHLGKRLDGEDVWEGIRWEVLEATGMEEIMERKPPVPLPKTDDFPAIGHLTAAEIAEMTARLSQGPLTTAAPSGRKRKPTPRAWLTNRILRAITHRQALSDADLRELLDEFANWLREAAARKQGLVFFYY